MPACARWISIRLQRIYNFSLFHAIIFICFGCLMGFTMHFYIIFGTNLLTGGLVQIAIFFCLFQCFAEKEYQMESKRNETFGSVIFGTNMIQRTWSGRQEINEEAMRQGGAPPTLVGPSWLHRPTSSSYIYLRTPKPSRSTTKT